MYGSATELVMTFGSGVESFILDPSLVRSPFPPHPIRDRFERYVHSQGEFIHVGHTVRLPKNGKKVRKIPSNNLPIELHTPDRYIP